MTDLLKIEAACYPVQKGYMPSLKLPNGEYRFKYSSVSGGPYDTPELAIAVANSVAASIEANVTGQLSRAAYGFKKMDDR